MGGDPPNPHESALSTLSDFLRLAEVAWNIFRISPFSHMCSAVFFHMFSVFLTLISRLVCTVCLLRFIRGLGINRTQHALLIVGVLTALCPAILCARLSPLTFLVILLFSVVLLPAGLHESSVIPCNR